MHVLRTPANLSPTWLSGLIAFLSTSLSGQVDRIKHAERPLTITLRRVPWTDLGPSKATAAPSRPTVEAQVPQGSLRSNLEVSAATSQGKSDGEIIQDLRNENAKLREELRLSNVENEVCKHKRASAILLMASHFLHI